MTDLDRYKYGPFKKNLGSDETEALVQALRAWKILELQALEVAPAMALMALPMSPSWNPMDSAVSWERPARRCPSKRGCHHDGRDRLAARLQRLHSPRTLRGVECKT